MTSFTDYWLTRGRPHCLARWPSRVTGPRLSVQPPL
jgi:hypothetical protein